MKYDMKYDIKYDTKYSGSWSEIISDNSPGTFLTPHSHPIDMCEQIQPKSEGQLDHVLLISGFITFVHDELR